VAARVEGLPAERACGSAGGDQRLGSAHEGTRIGRTDPDAQHIRAFLRIVRQLDIVSILGRRLGLDHDGLGCRIPGERHGADPKELNDRLIQRMLVSLGGHLGIDRVQEVLQPRGEGSHLGLLDPDAHEGAPLASLEEERAFAGLTDGAGHESVGVVEDEESSCHPIHRTRCRGATVCGADGHQRTATEPGLMRQRFRTQRDRAMARRPGGEGRFTLTRREKLIAGWLAAVAVIVVIAIALQVLGGDGTGTPVVPGTTPSASGETAETITFGTTLDETTGEVPATAVVDRFAEGDTFAYSVPPPETMPSVVYVEVERVAGGASGIVQDAATEGEQTIPAGRPSIGFTVAASRLLDVFGPGEYVMRIHLDPADAPIAEGRFILVGAPPASPSGS
jgi:hypothetical protein